ncbi:MAG TPA: hypothetical protein DEA78_11845, partial [Cyanobacteria bacterium UBA11159]|nr:hypothetical protein [Cyanobacteria bacterium UBA11159]
VCRLSYYAFNLYIPTPYTLHSTPLSINLLSNLDAPQLIDVNPDVAVATGKKRKTPLVGVFLFLSKFQSNWRNKS